MSKPESLEAPPPQQPVTGPVTGPVIGWREWLELPALGIDRIKAKIDTGARSSALHAFDIKHLPKKDGQDLVTFRTRPRRRGDSPGVECTAEVLDVRIIRSSNGVEEERITIRTPARLMGIEWPIELTLTSRDTMRFRMLLGREAIRGRFLVDSGTSYLDPTYCPRPKKRRS